MFVKENPDRKTKTKKKLAKSILMTQKLLLNTQMIWIIYIYIYINTKEFNLDRKRKILVVFDYVIADILSNEKFNQIIMELCIN